MKPIDKVPLAASSDFLDGYKICCRSRSSQQVNKAKVKAKMAIIMKFLVCIVF